MPDFPEQNLISRDALGDLLDALQGGTPGAVNTVTADELARLPAPISSHGFSVAAALALARQLHPGRIPPSLRIVAIGVARAERYCTGLSPAVAAAVGPAAGQVLKLVRAD